MCKRFFEKQRVDEIGYYSVRLQKVLIALAIFNLLGIFTGGIANWFGLLLEFILLWVAFFGAYKRQHRPLRAYVCINLTMMVLTVVFLVIALVYAGHVEYESDEIESEDLTHPSDMQDLYAPNNNTDLMDLKTPVNSTDINVNIGFDDNFRPGAGFFVVYLFAVLVSAFVFVLKFVSIVMAARLARMVCGYQCRQLSHPTAPFATRPVESFPTPAYQPMFQPNMQQPMFQPNMQQPMYVPVVINGQPNGQPQQFMYPNPYFVPQAMYTPMTPIAPPAQNDRPQN